MKGEVMYEGERGETKDRATRLRHGKDTGKHTDTPGKEDRERNPQTERETLSRL